MEEIVRRIKIFEGYSSTPYVCPAGKWTIGYGYNYEDRGFSVENLTELLLNGFSEELADQLLRDDVAECVQVLGRLLTFYHTLNEPRQAVVVDMIYQLGLAGFQKFRKMIKALESGDFEQTALQMQDSKWFKQSGRRSLINTAQMKTGIWQEVSK